MYIDKSDCAVEASTFAHKTVTGPNTKLSRQKTQTKGSRVTSVNHLSTRFLFTIKIDILQ